MNIFISSGETSGDQYAAELAKTLLANKFSGNIYGNGGQQMEKAGVNLIHNVIDKSTVGFIEPLTKVPYFLAVLKKTKSS